MPLVPQREREQSPELAREVLAARYMGVEDPLHRLGAEVALPSQGLRCERLARERHELAAQPRRRGDREATLATVDDLTRQQRLDRLAQQALLREAADLVPYRQREREVR